MINSDARFYLKTLGFTVLFGGLVVYGFFTARNLIEGPVITIDSPRNGESVDNPLVQISGTAQNISFISLNNRQIFIDGKGNFSEKLLVPEGYSIMKLYAKDRFGREITKGVGVVYKSSVVKEVVPDTASSTLESGVSTTTSSSSPAKKSVKP